MLSSKYRKLRMRIFQMLSVLTLAVLTWFVFRQKEGFQYIFGDLSYVWSDLFSGSTQYLMLLLVLFMMFLNWSAETMKWKRVALKLQKLSFGESLRSVLAGLAVGFFVPNRVGEYAGKALMLEKSNFWKASVLAFYTSYAQLFTTAFWGLVSLIFFRSELIFFFSVRLYLVSVSVLAVVLMVLLILFFYLDKISHLFRRRKRIYAQINVLSSLDFIDKLYVLAYSFMRFIIFSTQYIVLLLLLGIRMPFTDAFLIISLLYAVLMIMPTIAFTELPARSAVLLLILSAWVELTDGFYTDALELRVIIASTLIWLINIAAPAVIGAFFIPGFSIFKRKQA